MRRLLLPALLPLLLTACESHQGKTVSGEKATASPALGDVCAALMADGPLPGPPAVPLSGDLPVRILAFGDFGEQPTHGYGEQRGLSRVMAAYHDDHAFDFGITLGDNFYPRGLSSPDDPRWESQWERLYSPLGVRIYAVLGNHDHYEPGSPEAEQARSAKSATWCLPRPWYTFTAGPVQLFAVETTVYDKPEEVEGIDGAAQLEWLDRALAASRARWKVVYGHHPIYSNGEHGRPGRGSLPRVKGPLLPLLRKHKVDVYIAGHDHDLQALAPEDGIHFFVSGAGGRHLRGFDLDQCRVWGAERSYGFTVLEADPLGVSLKVSFVGEGEGDEPYKLLWGPVDLEKGASSPCRRP